MVLSIIRCSHKKRWANQFCDSPARRIMITIFQNSPYNQFKTVAQPQVERQDVAERCKQLGASMFGAVMQSVEIIYLMLLFSVSVWVSHPLPWKDTVGFELLSDERDGEWIIHAVGRTELKILPYFLIPCDAVWSRPFILCALIHHLYHSLSFPLHI